jgi:16S rRNA (guanine(966)-N(2))-methyltransferase RsmD
MPLRVIAGTLKGRKLEAPAGLETRPLPDRIKQSLFDWLGQDLSGQTVADVCAGSGTFAFEALSRGAKLVHAIESGRHAIPILHANHQAIGAPKELRIHTRAFQQVLPTLKDLDLIFCDPPFPWFSEDPAALTAMVTLAKAALAPSGIILVRGERGENLPPIAGVRENERREYGRSWIASLG